MHRSLAPLSLVLVAAGLAACGDGGSVTADSGVVDAGSGMDAVTDLGPPDTGASVPDVPPAADATDAFTCGDGGVVTDAGACLRCPDGQRVCGERCVGSDDPSTGCGSASCTPCAFPNAAATCMSGSCTQGRCNDGFADCDLNAATGCEVVTSSDRDNCGACGNHCVLPNALPGCTAGQCSVGSCAAGFGDCDGTASNGCEADVAGSLTNCGACGSHCAPANATGRCVAGACGVASCNAGFANCDGVASNGCETDVTTTLSSCGTCGTACAPPNAVGACVAGSCTVVSCSANWGDCDGLASNGCETDLRTTPGHCGTCLTHCTYPNATALCQAGGCAFGACAPGFSDCDGDPSTGCEVETASNVASCGLCGRVCTRNNATPGCVAGMCRIDHCDPGSANCNGTDADGCEVDINASLGNCGACGHACSLAHATALCDTGNCAVAACVPSYHDCNASPADGCESDSRSDVQNCGDCGTQCRFAHASAVCISSACGIGACDAGYGDCDGDIGSGCEARLSNDPANCGACAASCSDVCSAGVCTTCTTATIGNQCRDGTFCHCTGASCACM